GDLWHGDRLDDLLVVELADQGRHAVVAETARVERRRNEGVAERVHLDERREADRVTEVVDVLALREARTGARLDGDDAELLPLAGELIGKKRKGEAREVRAAADAAHEDVRLRVRLLELLSHLEADDGLVHEDVVEHAAERVLRVVARRRVLDRLADRDPEAAGRVRIRLEDFLARLRVGARARDDLPAVRLHQHAPVRLLLIGDLDHVHLPLQAEEVARGGGSGVVKSAWMLYHLVGMSCSSRTNLVWSPDLAAMRGLLRISVRRDPVKSALTIRKRTSPVNTRVC